MCERGRFTSSSQCYAKQQHHLALAPLITQAGQGNTRIAPKHPQGRPGRPTQCKTAASRLASPPVSRLTLPSDSQPPHYRIIAWRAAGLLDLAPAPALSTSHSSRPSFQAAWVAGSSARRFSHSAPCMPSGSRCAPPCSPSLACSAASGTTRPRGPANPGTHSTQARLCPTSSPRPTPQPRLGRGTHRRRGPHIAVIRSHELQRPRHCMAAGLRRSALPGRPVCAPHAASHTSSVRKQGKNAHTGDGGGGDGTEEAPDCDGTSTPCTASDMSYRPKRTDGGVSLHVDARPAPVGTATAA